MAFASSCSAAALSTRPRGQPSRPGIRTVGGSLVDSWKGYECAAVGAPASHGGGVHSASEAFVLGCIFSCPDADVATS
eukprot:3765787-Prymnesium_polylepis.1